MRKLLLFIAVCTYFQSLAQDPELFRTWYLYQMQPTDQTQVYNVSDFDPPIQPFLTILPTLEYSGQGACNTFNGTYSYDGNFLETNDFASTSDDCGSTSHNEFEDGYFPFFSFVWFDIQPNSNGLTLRFSHPLGGTATFKDNLLSVEDSETLSDFYIYPNPASDVLNISSNGNSIEYLAVYSISGQKLLSISGNTKTIDVSSFSEGIYFLEIVSENGRQVQKFIKR